MALACTLACTRASWKAEKLLEECAPVHILNASMTICQPETNVDPL